MPVIEDGYVRAPLPLVVYALQLKCFPQCNLGECTGDAGSFTEGGRTLHSQKSRDDVLRDVPTETVVASVLSHVHDNLPGRDDIA